MMNESIEQKFLAAHDAHSDAIFRFCYAQTGNRETAQDITQETFVRVFTYLTNGGTIDQMRPFLYRTARNALIDQYRRNRTRSLEAMTEKGFDVIDEHMDPTISAQISHAIKIAGQLDPKYREVVLMRYVDDLAPREIAHIVGESENTVSVRIHRGLEQLKKLLNLHD